MNLEHGFKCMQGNPGRFKVRAWPGSFCIWASRGRFWHSVGFKLGGVFRVEEMHIAFSSSTGYTIQLKQ